MMREFAIKIVTLFCIITIVTIVKMISLVYHFAKKIVRQLCSVYQLEKS